MWRKMYKYNKSWFSKVGAARRATGTKLTFVYFQKKHIFQFRLFYYFLASWPPAVFLVFGLRLFLNFWPPAVFQFLASGCSGCFCVRLFLWLPCNGVHANPPIVALQWSLARSPISAFDCLCSYIEASFPTFRCSLLYDYARAKSLQQEIDSNTDWKAFYLESITFG